MDFVVMDAARSIQYLILLVHLEYSESYYLLIGIWFLQEAR